MGIQEKRNETIVEKYGSIEAYNLKRYGTKQERSERMAKIGSKGGKSPHSYRGFRDKPGLAELAGIKSAEVRKK